MRADGAPDRDRAADHDVGDHRAGVEIGVLLAGGSSHRAGVDKRFLVLGGRTMLVRGVCFLRGLFPTVAVVTGRGPPLDLGDAAGVEMLRDAWPGRSPLVAIATALARFRRPLFVLAVDIAFPQRAAAEAVLDAFPGHDLALPTIAPHMRQPAFAAYGPACLAPMADLMASDRHRIIDIFPRASVARVAFSDDSLFHNINSLDDYHAAVRAREDARRQGGEPEMRPALISVETGGDRDVELLVDEAVEELIDLGVRVAQFRVAESGSSGRLTAPWRADASPLGAGSCPAPPPCRSRTVRDLTGMDLAVIRTDRGSPPSSHRQARDFSRRGSPLSLLLSREGAGFMARLLPTALRAGVGPRVLGTGALRESGVVVGDAVTLAHFIAVRLDTLRAVA